MKRMQLFYSLGNKGVGFREDLQNENICPGRSLIASLTVPFIILSEVAI